ncbi:MAG: electron transport complex subunit E [Candidatus Cloacimonetes bacterium]|nr:electron transport complex subunit E [Candidatus Cloacimonadota bacterium]
MSLIKEMTKGFVKENPVFIMALGLCPVLAVSTSIENAIGMGLAATFVLLCSNILISLLKDVIPTKVRIPCFIVVIASFVTIVDMLMNAYTPEIHKNLGIFIPLIVVNCIILGRAEAFASRNSLFKSIFDGLGMGIGFTLALVLVAFFRELLGAGQLLGIQILPVSYQPVLLAILAPGAFLTLGLLMGALNLFKKKEVE